jgi:hypothetical protein
VSTFQGSTFVVDWVHVPEKRTHKFVARCDMHPGWRYKCPAYDEQAKADAESSLRGFIAEHASFEHYAPAGEWAL